MVISHIILACLWILYCFLHSALAGLRIKSILRKRMGLGFRYYRLYYTLFSFVFLLVILWFQIHLSTVRLYATKAPILTTGIVLSAAGALLMLICIRKYFMSLSGVLSLVRENVSNSLIITGVHRFIRHPLYLGTFAFIWGLFMAVPYLSLLIANTIITVYTVIGINLEEDKLIAEFGDSYKSYQQNVPKLLPSIKNQTRYLAELTPKTSDSTIWNKNKTD